MANSMMNQMARRTYLWSGAIMALAPLIAPTAWAQVPGGCTTPVGERTSEVGCYVDANEPLGELPKEPVFWHLYNYPTRAAAESAKPPHGTVVESFGKVWLYAIATANWHPPTGQRVASDRRPAVLWLRPARSQRPAARAHHGEAGGQSFGRGRCGQDPDHGPSREPDTGIF